jgi:hypothetical protein
MDFDVNEGASIDGLSANGILYHLEGGVEGSGAGLYLRGFGPDERAQSMTSVIGSASGAADIEVYAASASVLAWIANGVAYAAPLPVVNLRPWDLGDPIYRRSFAPAAGKTWKLLVPFDAALTSCKVVLHKKTRVLRTLPCSSTYIRNGDAVVSWNGRKSSGRKVAGKVTWTLRASGPAGSALNASGKPGPIGGTVTVS